MSTFRGKCAYLKVFDSHRILAVAKDQVGKRGNDATTSIKGDTTVALTHFFLVVFKRFSDSKSFQSLGFFHGWPFPLHLFGCFVTVNIFTRSSSPSSYSSPALTNSKFLAFRSLFIFVLPACRHCCHRVFCFVLLTILLECMRTLFWTLLTEESVLKFSGFFFHVQRPLLVAAVY